jgi:phosphate starvation-inducible protein PhoH and related proteins
MPNSASTSQTIDVGFDDTIKLRALFGVEDSHLRQIEASFGVAVNARGRSVAVKGKKARVDEATHVLHRLARFIDNGREPSTEEIGNILRLLLADSRVDIEEIYRNPIHVPSRRRHILPKTPGQREYITAIRNFDMVFGIGPAGTGKTYLAMAMAVESLVQKSYDRIILCRPAVEAGEKLGFLPGSMQEKVNPYLRPLYDALHDMMDGEHAQRLIDDGAIEVAPLAFMRGRTLARSFVILDEAQNCTPEQMKMFLTRLGPESKAVITGDITQIDLPDAVASGLVEALRILSDVQGIEMYYLTERDVVRHRLVQSIIEAYEAKGGSGI